MKDRQLNIFDLLNEPIKRPDPHFVEDQIIYVSILDEIEEFIVDWVYDLKHYYGYSLDNSRNGQRTSGHRTVWCRDVGTTAFHTLEEATEVTSKLALNKINKEDIETHSEEYREYIREVDGYHMQSLIAKVGTHQIYSKQFMLYRFLDTYQTEKERDAVFEEISKHESRHGGEPIEFDFTRLIKDVYYVNKTRWSDPRYAITNGKPFGGCK